MRSKGCERLGAKLLTIGLNSGKAELFQEAVVEIVENLGGVEAFAKKAKMSVLQLKRALASREAFQRWVDIAKIVKVLSNSRMAFHVK
jgi:DNA-binding phage protein